jgi:hypothetical protein
MVRAAGMPETAIKKNGIATLGADWYGVLGIVIGWAMQFVV